MKEYVHMYTYMHAVPFFQMMKTFEIKGVESPMIETKRIEEVHLVLNYCFQGEISISDVVETCKFIAITLIIENNIQESGDREQPIRVSKETMCTSHIMQAVIVIKDSHWAS